MGRADTLQMNHLLCQLIPAQTPHRGEERKVEWHMRPQRTSRFCSVSVGLRGIEFRLHSLGLSTAPASLQHLGDQGLPLPQRQMNQPTRLPQSAQPCLWRTPGFYILKTPVYFPCFLSPRAGQALCGLIPVTPTPFHFSWPSNLSNRIALSTVSVDVSTMFSVFLIQRCWWILTEMFSSWHFRNPSLRLFCLTYDNVA